MTDQLAGNDRPQPEDKGPIEFVLGTGNHSVICGATTPVVTVDLGEPSDEPVSEEAS